MRIARAAGMVHFASVDPKQLIALQVDFLFISAYKDNKPNSNHLVKHKLFSPYKPPQLVTGIKMDYKDLERTKI